MFKKVLLALLMTLTVVSTAVSAQTVVSSNKLAWDQAAPTLADAQAYSYKLYNDGATTGVAAVGVTCTGTVSPYQCEVAFPAFTPGNHSTQLSATNAAGESAKSVALPFTFVVTPAVPASLRIK